MAVKYAVVPLEEKHVLDIFKDPRSESPLDLPKETFEDVLKQVGAEEAWAALADDKVIAVFGAHHFNFLSTERLIWMMTSKEIDKHSYTFLKYTKSGIKKIAKAGPLIGYVRQGWDQAVKYAEFLGFKFIGFIYIDETFYHVIRMEQH